MGGGDLTLKKMEEQVSLFKSDLRLKEMSV